MSRGAKQHEARAVGTGGVREPLTSHLTHFPPRLILSLDEEERNLTLSLRKTEPAEPCSLLQEAQHARHLVRSGGGLVERKGVGGAGNLLCD